MAVRLVEWVESAPGTESVRFSGKSSDAGRGRKAHQPSAGPAEERLEVRVAATVEGIPPLFVAEEVSGRRAQHLWCPAVDDLDMLGALAGRGFDYLAVALGDGLDRDPKSQELLDGLEELAASMTTPVFWHTARGSVGQNLLRVRDALRFRPDLRLALDFPEIYCAHDMLAGFGLWKAVLAEIRPRTAALIVGDGDSARTPLAPPQEGLLALPHRWSYARRQRQTLAAFRAPLVCWRTAHPGVAPGSHQ